MKTVKAEEYHEKLMRGLETMNNDLMFSSANQAWATRWNDFNKWNERFYFTIDVCAGFDDQKCKEWYTPEEDGLTQSWNGNANDAFWCNPPYGAEQKKWVNYGFNQKASGVFLLPSRTDTILFHDTIVKGQKAGYCNIEFIKGRITFGSDDYWAWLWDIVCFDKGGNGLTNEECKRNGFDDESMMLMEHIKSLGWKYNSLYQKYGKMNPAPFASMLVKCGDCKDL